MRNLPPPDRADALDHLVEALRVRQWRGTTVGYAASHGELDALIALYDAYDGARGAPSKTLLGGALAHDLKHALERAYRRTYEGGSLEPIRTRVMSVTHRCPVCGIGAATELDHFLPKSVYKALAIYVRNLIPLCHDCNHAKGTTVNEDPARQFVHAYFDELPDTAFLLADVDIEGDGLTAEFTVSDTTDLSDELRVKLSFQFEMLKLNDRYQPEINVYLTSQAVSLNMVYAADGSDFVRGFLLAQADVEETAFHRNHWRPLLLRALADHEDFCDGGFRDILPTPPGATSELRAAVEPDHI